MNRAPDAADAQRAQVALSAIQSLATRLGEAPGGRKSLLLVSEGFVRRARRENQRLPDVQSIVRTANTGHVAIYVLDPGADQEPPGAGSPPGRTGSAQTSRR